MTRKTFATIGIVTALLVSLFGTVAAQTGTSDTPTPEPTSSKFYTHPVVQILSAYFSRNMEDITEPGTPTDTPDPDAETETPDPNNPSPTPTETPDPQELLAEEIAAYHEQGLGFGVLVKLYAMAEASQEACPTETTGDTTSGDTTTGDESACTPLTVADLKALKNQESTPEPQSITTTDKKGNKPVKDNKPPKNNNGKGNH
jgi:hypothetical protein